MKKIIASLILLAHFSYLSAQTVEDKLEGARMSQIGKYLYVYNVQDRKQVNVKKYDLNLALIASYTKKLEKKSAEINMPMSPARELWTIDFGEGGMEMNVQTTKEKKVMLSMSAAQYPRERYVIHLDYDLKEVSFEEATSNETLPLLSMDAYVGNSIDRPITDGGDYPLDKSAEETMMSQNGIYEKGPNVSAKAGPAIITAANYKESSEEKKYRGFYLMKTEGNNTPLVKKYNYFEFKDLAKQDELYMEFYPELVKVNDNTVYIPFAQKTKNKITVQGQFGPTTVYKFCIMGVGVLEVDAKTMSMKNFVYDRKYVSDKLMAEYVIDFQVKSLQDFALCTMNFQEQIVTSFTKTQFFIYNQSGVVYDEKEKKQQIILTGTKEYITFKSEGGSYTLSKVKF